MLKSTASHAKLVEAIFNTAEMLAGYFNVP